MKKYDRALLVAVSDYSLDATKISINELKGLARANNINPVDEVIQSLPHPDPRYYVGSGKVLELKQIIALRDCDLVIFDDTLSATQIRNLEATLEVQIIDRSFLILQIFAERAKTKESILEVSLAQKLYMLPRLIGMSNSLSRQGGGSFNAKGPGETKLELDRRKLSHEISLIKHELALIKKEREVSRQKRTKSGIPVVALVGYTNAGKSSLMNYFASRWGTDKEDVFEKDLLFATLDTKTKRIQLPQKSPFLLIDTVGFISKLPTELIASFESTLSDIASADLILHVIDGLDLNEEHIMFVNHILKQLNLIDIPRLLVVTKKDLRLNPLYLNEDVLFVSSKTDEHMDLLIQSIEALLYPDHRIYHLKLSFSDSGLIETLKKDAQVLEIKYLEDGIFIRAILSPKLAGQLKSYILS